jgi:hypothetical protein
MNQDIFKAELNAVIDAKFAEIIKSKSADKQFFTYFDMLTVTTSVRNVFKNIISIVPPQIEASCKMSEAILAPTINEKKELIQKSVGIAGGTTGIAMVIGGMGAALGWGQGVVASVVAFFVGSSVAGPIGWIAGGVALAAVAGYFAFKGDESTNTERALAALKNALDQAVDAIWPEYGDKLEIKK